MSRTDCDGYIYIHTNSRRLEHCDYLPRLSARQSAYQSTKVKCHFPSLLLPVYTDETFPIDSEVIITTYPVSWVQCGVQVLMLCVRKWPSMLPSPLPLPNTGPPVQQQDCCSEEYKGESAVLPFRFRRSWCELVVLCKPASWSSLLVPPCPTCTVPIVCRALELLS